MTDHGQSPIPETSRSTRTGSPAAVLGRWEAPGAVALGDGRFRITLWAPHADEVVVHLPAGDHRRQVAMVPQEKPSGGVGGYHSIEIDGCNEQTSYWFSMDGGTLLPDPASRWQRAGVHGPSTVLDTTGFDWSSDQPVDVALADTVLYELHVGTFTELGTFDAVADHLSHLVDLGVTTVELMPVAQFPGTRNWGYDGVFPYAVQDSYGGPHGLARLVAACHRRGLAVALDVVYNHLGPEGNILPAFGPYTTDRYATPWGPAINYDGWGSDEVRRFFVGNALWWFDQFHIDVLRLDAVHGIVDPTAHPFLQELGEATAALAKATGRRLLLIAESADNNPRIDRPVAAGGVGMDGQWSDDFHHALHSVLTAERTSYYQDFGSLDQLATAVDGGFVFTGQFSSFRGRCHGQPSDDLQPWQLVTFSQNHDQIGNRPRGDRLAATYPIERARLAAVLTLLAPGTPLLFMGEEYGETAPFPYFVDHQDPDLIEAVRRGRAAEMGDQWDTDPLDPADPDTYRAAVVDVRRSTQPDHQATLGLYRDLVQLRTSHPALAPATTTTTTTTTFPEDNLLMMLRQCRSDDRAPISLVLLWHAGPGTVTTPLPALGPDPVGWRLLLGQADQAPAARSSGTTGVAQSTVGPWSFAVLDQS